MRTPGQPVPGPSVEAATGGAGRRPVVAFFVLAYAISWAWAVPQALAGQVVRRGRFWPTHYPALLGPLLAAVIVTAWTAGGPGLRELAGRMVRWRVGLRWWLVALSPLLFLIAGLTAMALSGQDLPPLREFGRFSGTPAVGVLGVALLITLVNGLGEETGWRGFALPRLQRRFGALAATLILAPLWALWHLPQFFVIETYRDFAAVQYVGMVLGLSCGAVVLTWLYNRCGASILLVAVWHATFNLCSGTEASAGALAGVISTLVMAQGITLVVLELRALRHGRPSVIGPR